MSNMFAKLGRSGRSAAVAECLLCQRLFSGLSAACDIVVAVLPQGPLRTADREKLVNAIGETTGRIADSIDGPRSPARQSPRWSEDRL
jgi:hypothetical protein